MEDRWTHALMRQVGDAADVAALGLGKADCVDKRALNRRQRILAGHRRGDAGRRHPN